MKRLLVLALVLIPFLCSACADEKPKESAPVGPNPVVLIKTSMGDIKAELFARKAPITVKNFLEYVDKEHYDGTVFHRVIPTFMIQGGGFKKGLATLGSPNMKKIYDMEKPTGAGIKNEARRSQLSNERGTLAMARTPDPDSATAQFFINVKDNEALDPSEDNPAGYAVFGKVIEGMAVVDKIKAVRTRALVPGQFTDVPVTDVVIQSIRRVDP